MFVPILLFLLGFLLLIKGGDWFVDGATGIAHKFHIPEILIGATVVSIGTTLPEVMVSANSALSGHGEIAYGNAIGSIICNTALIAAITVAVKPSKVERKSLILPVIFFFGAAVFYSAVAYATGYFSRTVGFILTSIFLVYMIFSVLNARKSMIDGKDNSKEDDEDINIINKIILLVVGAAVIAFGADLLVDNGIIIAQAIGVPEAVIGLTVVALGTSLPEFVTAITSLVKGHGALSLGNVIGANLFNLVLVSGVSTVLSPFAIPQSSAINGVNTSLVVDIPVMFFVMSLLVIPTLIRGKLSRMQGIILLVTYVAFCIFQFTL
ncbi:MAG: calcium/sodium antiporter [Ruminococcaceae bacterium]|nr:calcium/sodium antiporter [Oscillospiraceae bacterium]